MQDYIKRIKEIMTLVSTGEKQIQEFNEEYQELWRLLNEVLLQNRIKNPNSFSDLWEFYEFWKKKLPSYASRRAYVAGLYKNIFTSKISAKNNSYNYINLERLKELRVIQNKNFDLIKLIKFCEELNSNFYAGCYLSCAMIVRSILDHIPPIFQCKNFNEVANCYGTKSFKESMLNLNNSSRKIADSYLHTPIRNKEVLPNNNQVDFCNDLDVLLGEICRILK